MNLKYGIAMTVFALVLTVSIPGRSAQGADPVSITGTLHSGIVAIGAETTGTELQAGKRKYELEFNGEDRFQERAEALDGKQVTVQGKLRLVGGVEVKHRWIIDVTQLQSAELPVAVSFRKEETDVQVLPAATQQSAVLVAVLSETGIDSGEIRRTGKNWPEKVIVRLYLKGLESATFAAGEQTLKCSVSKEAPNELHASLQQGNEKERKLAAGDDWFPGFKVHCNTPVSGYEFVLPAKLLAGNPEQITVSFVDFYRQ